MSEYKCSNCGQEYTFEEHSQLDRVPVDPEEPDPMQGKGYVRVCECGNRFHLDDWGTSTEVTDEDHEFRVSTVFLNLNHGTDAQPMWYETCVFWDDGSYVLDRYGTKEEAEEGHERVVNALREGRYTFQSENFVGLKILEASDV